MQNCGSRFGTAQGMPFVWTFIFMRISRQGTGGQVMVPGAFLPGYKLPDGKIIAATHN